MPFTEFDWDSGNWPKCGKHGVTKAEIEAVFRNDPQVGADPNSTEKRFRAVGISDDGRHVFVVFTFRDAGAHRHVRPISARFMHGREIKRYEQR